MDVDKRVNYLIIIAISYCLLFLTEALPFIPEWQHIKSMVVVFVYTISFYFVFKLVISIWKMSWFSETALVFYSFRISSIIAVFLFHIFVFCVLIFFLGNPVYNPELLYSKDFPEQNVTFYVYNDSYYNKPTLITVRQGTLPLQKKLYQLKYIEQDRLSIDYEDNRFVICDDNFKYFYPKKDYNDERDFDLRY